MQRRRGDGPVGLQFGYADRWGAPEKGHDGHGADPVPWTRGEPSQWDIRESTSLV